jgi:hypothetical protein
MQASPLPNMVSRTEESITILDKWFKKHSGKMRSISYNQQQITMKYRVSKSNISNRRSNSKKKKEIRSRQLNMAERENKMATKPAAHTVHSHFAACLRIVPERYPKRGACSTSFSLPPIREFRFPPCNKKIGACLFVHHVSYVSHMSSKRKSREKNQRKRGY